MDDLERATAAVSDVEQFLEDLFKSSAENGSFSSFDDKKRGILKNRLGFVPSSGITEKLLNIFLEESQAALSFVICDDEPCISFLVGDQSNPKECIFTQIQFERMLLVKYVHLSFLNKIKNEEKLLKIYRDFIRDFRDFG